MLKPVVAVTLALASVSSWAHGWLTAPLSRTEWLSETDRAAVGYEPQSVASNLTGGGSSTLAQIHAYPGGPLAFFKRYHVAQDSNLCANANQQRWPPPARQVISLPL